MNFKISDFMLLVNNKITGGTAYTNPIYGSNLHVLDSEKEDLRRWGTFLYSAHCAYSLDTSNVVELQIFDYQKEVEYRFVSEEFRGITVPFTTAEDELDKFKLVELEELDDFLEKAKAIINGEEYDTRVMIPLNMNKDELYVLMLAAHTQDITLNQFMTEVIKEAISKYE